MFSKYCISEITWCGKCDSYINIVFDVLLNEILKQTNLETHTLVKYSFYWQFTL